MGPSRAASDQFYLFIVRRRRWLLALIVAVFVDLALRLGGVSATGRSRYHHFGRPTSAPFQAYVNDYRARIAPPAFGLPERRSKERREHLLAEAVSDEEAVVSSADPLGALSGAGGTSAT